jgi:hypothetical protein
MYLSDSTKKISVEFDVMYRYFDEEDDEDNMAYQPAPGSPGEDRKEDSDEEDPLDAFMADIEVYICTVDSIH